MTAPKIAIVCQGGGFHGAFTAGALCRILEEMDAGSTPSFMVTGLSGTSAGALNAFMTWYGLAPKPSGSGSPGEAIAAVHRLWETFQAKTPSEILFNSMVLQALKAHGRGAPSVKVSPYSLLYDLFIQNLRAVGIRKEFYDFGVLLDTLAPDFHAIDQRAVGPRLLLGAVEIRTGTFCPFDSRADPASRRNISLKAVQASGTLPELRRAEEIETVTFSDGRVGTGYYWDGVFSQNPPVREFLTDAPLADRPDEIWLIRINPVVRSSVPTRLEEIEDRRNELAGNLSVEQELAFIRTVNGWRASHPDLAAVTKHVHIKEIVMSAGLSERLDLASKFDRSDTFVAELMADGHAQAEVFLRSRRAHAPGT